MQDQNAVTPERIFQTINAFQSSAALKGALDPTNILNPGKIFEMNEAAHTH